MALWSLKNLQNVALFNLMYSISYAVANRCPSYCDDDGYYISGFYCYQPQPFCCGDHSFRFCCRNATQDISSSYPDVYMCPHSSWWLFHWQVALGMLGGVILLLLIAACCCKACLRNGPESRRRRRSYRRRTTCRSDRTLTTDSTDEPPPSIQVFNPDAPFAFEPPSYESLPKAPPKYSDVFGTTPGSDNFAYIPETDDLPPYSVHDSSQTTPGTSAVIGVHQVTSSGQGSVQGRPKENENEIFVTNVEMQDHGLNITPKPERRNGDGEGNNSAGDDEKEQHSGSNV